MITHILNSTLYRTDTTTPLPELEEMSAAYEHETTASDVEVDDDELESEAMKPVRRSLGIYFLATLECTNGHLSLDGRRTLDAKNLAGLYMATDMVSLAAKFGVHSIVVRRPLMNPNRRPNRQIMTNSTLENRTIPIPELDLGLHGGGVRPVANGLALRGGRRARDDDEPAQRTDDKLCRLWEQFKHDILLKAPTPLSTAEPGYLTATHLEIANTPDGLFQSPALPLRKARMFVVGTGVWGGLMFDRFFPVPGTVIEHKVQNYTNCQYWGMYGGLMREYNSHDQVRVRGALRGLFESLLWLPWPESERMWSTRQDGHAMAVRIPRDSQGPAPVIALNPLHHTKNHNYSIRPQPDETNDIQIDDGEPDPEVPFEVSSDEDGEREERRRGRAQAPARLGRPPTPAPRGRPAVAGHRGRASVQPRRTPEQAPLRRSPAQAPVRRSSQQAPVSRQAEQGPQDEADEAMNVDHIGRRESTLR